MKTLLCSFAVLCTFTVQLWTAALFNEITIADDINGTCAVAAADFNEDGHTDIVYTCYQGSHIQWMENDGTQQFSQHMVIENFTHAKAIDVSDLNLDGHIDFAATSTDCISWFQNDGQGNFTEHVLSSSWDQPSYIQLTDSFTQEPVDVDSDGLPDVVVLSCQSDRLSWFRNNGDGSFTEHSIRENWIPASGISVLDVDGDGDTDMLIAGSEDGSIRWLEQVAGGDFAEHTLYTGWDKPNWIMGGDIDGDGDIDFAATSCGNSKAVGWFENDGAQSFTLHVLRENYTGSRCPVIVDIDGDGDTDLFSIAWQASLATFFENTGDEVFTERTISTTGYDMLKLFVTDLDNDGDLDLIASSDVANNVHLRWFESLDHFLITAIQRDYDSGHAPLTVHYQDDSYSLPDIVSREWDLDGDGLADASGQSVDFTYSTPGAYAASVTLDNGIDQMDYSFDTLLRIFDGESCMEFDGESGVCDAGAGEALALEDTFTWEAWIYPHSWGENASQGGRILDKGVISLCTCEVGEDPDYAGLVVRMGLTQNTTFAAWTQTGVVPLGMWSHVAITWNASTPELHVYVNGQEQTIDWLEPPAGSIINNTLFALRMGNSSGNGYTFDGRIDDVRVWNVCRPASEIAANMQTYLQGNETGLTGYWKMNEGNGDTLYDQTVNGNDMSIMGAGWTQGTHFEFTGVEQPDEVVPVQTNLECFPNPFNPTTTFRFTQTQAGHTELVVYDIRGRKVKELLSSSLTPGSYEVSWNGRDDRGREVGSGIYLCMYRCGDKASVVRKCVLVK